MKKLFYVIAIIAVITFASCGDENKKLDDITAKEPTEIFSVEKDKVDPRGNEDPDDTEE